MKAWSSFAAAALLLVACGGGGSDGEADTWQDTGPKPGVTCTKEQLAPESLIQAGALGEKEAILPNGRRISPVGDLIPTNRFPLGVRINTAGTRAYVAHNGNSSVSILDLEKDEPAQVVPIDASPFRAIAVSPDEKRLYVGGGHSGYLYVFTLGADGLCSNIDGETGNAVPDETVYLGGYISDIETTADGKTLYAVAATNSRVYVLNTDDLSTVKTLKAGVLPYDMELSADGKRLYFSNLSSSTVTVVDTGSGEMLASIPAGRNPMSIALAPDGSRLYAASSDTDELYVIDTGTNEVEEVVDLTGHPMMLKHGNVNGVAVSPDGGTVFVSEASFNKVDVIDASSLKVIGAIPTGWYPTEVTAGTDALYVATSKGMGSVGFNGLKSFGSFLAEIPYPDPATLSGWTATVDSNNSRTQGFFSGTCEAPNIPVLRGKDSPIEHVVLIVRENKTYDMIMGDFERGDGDPNLVVFDEKYTANFHKAAREFVNFDNYYANAEASIQGHMWTTTAHCNDFTEKSYFGSFFTIPGFDIATLSGPGSIFDHCFAHGVSFRNYGEFPSFGQYMFDEYLDYFDSRYPFWTNAVPDVDKAAEVIREIELGIFPQFVYIVLPNDHTYGGDPGKPTPQTLVADNDRGTAMLLEAISGSIYWPKTAVFVIEDDPQGSGDHVEAHRSPAMVVSPWVKRGYTSSVHYDIPSLYRTIELILGLPPIGRNDALAAPMLDIWVDGVNEQPDYTPFTGVPVDVPWELNPEKSAVADALKHCDFSKLDDCPGMGAVLWKMMKGDVEPPPYAKGIDW